LDHRNSLQSSQVDLIYDCTLLVIVKRHRTNQNLITTFFYEQHANALNHRDGPPLNLVTVLDPRLGVLMNLQELEGFGLVIEIRMKMMHCFPTYVLSSTLVPTHVFVCFPTVIDLLLDLRQLTSFKHHFGRWLAKNQ